MTSETSSAPANLTREQTDVLRLFANEHDGLTTSDVQRKSGKSYMTSLRICNSLEGLICKSSSRGPWMLTLKGILHMEGLIEDAKG